MKGEEEEGEGLKGDAIRSMSWFVCHFLDFHRLDTLPAPLFSRRSGATIEVSRGGIEVKEIKKHVEYSSRRVTGHYAL